LKSSITPAKVTSKYIDRLTTTFIQGTAIGKAAKSGTEQPPTGRPAIRFPSAFPPGAPTRNMKQFTWSEVLLYRQRSGPVAVTIIFISNIFVTTAPSGKRHLRRIQPNAQLAYVELI
jgi:hypothetical protein